MGTLKEHEVGPFPMRTAGPEGGKRGACSECGRPETVAEVLTSVNCKKAVCSQCVTLKKYAKELR